MTVPVILPRNARLPALSTVLAARLPKRGARTGSGVFDAAGDIVVECDVTDDQGLRCGWGCAGPRVEVGRAVAEHRRMYHSQATGAIVTLLNHPRQ